jgi:SAM-dependent methyltransferase
MSSCADIRISALWQSDSCRHREDYFFYGIILDSDDAIATVNINQLLDQQVIQLRLSPEQLIPAFNIDLIHRVPRGTLDIKRNLDTNRYYPSSWFTPEGHRHPAFALLCEQDADTVTIDLNHPLAGYSIKLSVTLISQHDRPGELSFTKCLRHMLADGPGMQRCAQIPQYPLNDNMLGRLDEADDFEHYRQPDYEDTFDPVSGRALAEFYGEFLQPDMRILDIMCGAQSYLPPAMANLHATGIGLNRQELEANSQLQDFLVHNVNSQTTLPYADNTFDAVLFTAAVEYLVEPYTTFSELKRITRPHGQIIVTFTDHWNTFKNIALWQELPLFERMRLVMHYLQHGGGIGDPGTRSIRGLKRDADDTNHRNQPGADPIFAVFARVA